MTVKRVGKSAADLAADRVRECREIVRSIVQFGVDDDQMVTIMRLLALELEDRDMMLEVVGFFKELGGGLTIDQGIVGAEDGKTDG